MSASNIPWNIYVWFLSGINLFYIRQTISHFEEYINLELKRKIWLNFHYFHVKDEIRSF